jgi:hypothetical protein
MKVLGIKPEELTDEAWDYVFGMKEVEGENGNNLSNYFSGDINITSPTSSSPAISNINLSQEFKKKVLYHIIVE